MEDYRRLRRPSLTKRNRAALGYYLKLAEQGFEVEVERLIEDHGTEAVAIQIAADTYKQGTSYIKNLINWHSSREASRNRKKRAAEKHGR